MLSRYRAAADGRHTVAANVYTREEHGLDRGAFLSDALGVIRRLTRGGHEAYIVGGAIRDLLTERTPKDFDIATSARPREVTRLFARSRVIGRRFKLVHVSVGCGVLEVSTFRGPGAEGSNHYGTIAEDALRRDFTINGLYYSPEKEQVIDYVSGFPDLQDRRLRAIGDAETAFVEDPVRMLRAAKYACFMGVKVPDAYRRLIRRHAARLAGCSAGRLSEELRKVLCSGKAADVLLTCATLGLLGQLIPSLADRVRPSRKDPLFVNLSRAERGARDPDRARLHATAVLATFGAANGLPSVRGVKEAFSPLVITNEDARAVVAQLRRHC